MRIIPGDFDDRRIIDLLAHHFISARAQTAAGSAHALDLGGLQSPDIGFWALWDGEALLGIGALKRLSVVHGEVKSMHIAEVHRGRGAGSAMLDHIIAAARADGLARLSLETGSWEYFLPARRLYARRGFVECAPFGDYRSDPNSVFMTLDLQETRA